MWTDRWSVTFPFCINTGGIEVTLLLM